MNKLFFLMIMAAGFCISQNAMSATLCPDGSYVSGDWCHLTPSGKYVGDRDGDSVYSNNSRDSSSSSGYSYNYSYQPSFKPRTLCPDGSYVQGECELTPNGRYVGK